MPEGQGNPSFGWRTFKGRYTLTVDGASATSDIVMLDCTNDVQILGDFVFEGYTANTAFAKLPEDVRPDTPITVPCALEGASGYVVVPLKISATGDLSLALSFSGHATLYTSGINYNISERWYG